MANPNHSKFVEMRDTYGPAAAGILTMVGISTVFLHRGETHRALKFKRAPRLVARTATWVGSGMRPKWVGVHLKHHDDTDGPEDPHSPVQNGRFGVAKVLVGNALMYRKAKRKLAPEDIPARLAPDKLDKVLFDRAALGLTALYGIYLGVQHGNVKKAAKTWSAHVGGVLLAGGVINALAHAGEGSMAKALINGPQPDENGNYARNLNIGTTEATLGEGSHLDHHKNPGNIWMNENHWLDPGGMLAVTAIRLGAAELGTEPPQERQVV